MVSFVPPLDSGAVAYAKLLSNPCTGPLVHGPGSSEGGQVARFEVDLILGAGATETGFIVHWTPGALNNGAGANGVGVLQSGVVADGTNVTLNNSLGTFPGAAFLQANASSYRALAGCVQAYFVGSEVNRQGIVSGALSTYGFLNNTALSTSSGAIRSVSPVVERTPSTMFEVKWAPSYSDGLFRNPSGVSPPEDGHSSLTLTAAGLPVATGMRLRLVVVVEWRPKTNNLVLSSNTSTDTSSSATIQTVRRYLDNRDANWWNNLGATVRNTLEAGIALGGGIMYGAFKGPSMPRLEL